MKSYPAPTGAYISRLDVKVSGTFDTWQALVYYESGREVEYIDFSRDRIVNMLKALGMTDDQIIFND